MAQNLLQEQNYVEVKGSATDTIEANKIEISITLTEEPSKGKLTIDEQQRRLEMALKEVGIDIKEQVVLVSQSLSAAKRTNVYQWKNYLLTVDNVALMNEVFALLDSYKIPSVRVKRYYNDSMDSVIMSLKAKAVRDAKRSAQNLAEAIDQSIGKAISIIDYSSAPRQYYDAPMLTRTMANGGDSAEVESELSQVELKPIILTQTVTVKFALL